jgi:hypothetical protein
MQGRYQLNKVENYYKEKLETYGPTPLGVGWNSHEAQEIRFFQLTKVIDSSEKYTLLDFGSGFGAIYDYLVRLGHKLRYIGYDVTSAMVEKGYELHPGNPDCSFTSSIDEALMVDYAVLSGTFNLKLDADFEAWTKHILGCLNKMNELSQKGFSFNMLSNYSDTQKMRPELYYGNPLLFFDYCKRNFSQNVALLHDYTLYDFTILVRKG